MEKGGGAARTTSLYITAQIRSFKLTFSIAARQKIPLESQGPNLAAGRVMGEPRLQCGGHVQVTNPIASFQALAAGGGGGGAANGGALIERSFIFPVSAVVSAEREEQPMRRN